VGSRVVVTRRVGRRERAMTAELAELNPPSTWGVRGIDGPVRGNVKGTIEPLDDGARSRVTIELAFEGHGIGKLLVPIVVRRQAQKEVPRNQQKLKERLESCV
jgi:Polyketide cyclase / dehydrase and lipid transport